MLQYPGYALLVEFVFDVFCLCIMLENKVTTITTTSHPDKLYEGPISMLFEHMKSFIIEY